MNCNTCVVVFAHFSHIWERVLTYFSMISIIRLFIFLETFILAILLSDFHAFLGDLFNFFVHPFSCLCQNCASDVHLRIREMNGSYRDTCSQTEMKFRYKVS